MQDLIKYNYYTESKKVLKNRVLYRVLKQFHDFY